MQQDDVTPKKTTQWRPIIELFLLSFVSLYCELLVIRWMSSDFRSIAVLKTFPLVACFVGLGVGFAQTGGKAFRWVGFALGAVVIFIRLSDMTGMSQLPYPTATLYQWGNLTSLTPSMWGFIAFFMVWLALVLAGPFFLMLGLGARMGQLFNQLPPLTAYSWNILGAVLGSLLFSALSFFTWPPSLLLILPFATLLYYGRPVKLFALPLVAALIVALIPIATDVGTIWSPYFRLNIREVHADGSYEPEDKSPAVGYLIRVNQMFQQYFFPDMTKKNGLSGEMSRLFTVRERYYALPYQITKPEEVLVLGCGVGQDVRAAVQNGAKSIDAVEIDPVVLSQGRKYNDVYNDPKVHLICNDARNFVNRTDKKYDLIVLACLDSLAVTGLGSSVRIDSYVHTEESLHKVLSLLKPNGIFVMSFGAGGGHWLRDRLYNTMKTAAGYDPIYFTDEKEPASWPAYIYVAGPPVQRHELKLKDNYDGILLEKLSDVRAERILTDDWPYLYISPKGIDVPYLLLIVEIILLSIFAARKTLLHHNSFSSWQMFFLGSAFLLLELESISRLSLLYGATWLTSSIVINGVLGMILAANVLVIKFKPAIAPRLSWVFFALFGTLLVNYFLPVTSVVESSIPMAHLLTTVITLLPMFLAGIIFATSFSLMKSPTNGLAFNILGSVFGAVLELLSSYTGVKALLLVALVLYFSAYVCWSKASSSSPEVEPAAS